jgi:hypothetical protein
MDLDVDIENIEFPEDERRAFIEKELIVQENIFDEEESLILHNASFDKEIKKLLFQHVNSRGKMVKDSTMNLRGVPTSKISKIHMVIGNALDI